MWQTLFVTGQGSCGIAAASLRRDAILAPICGLMFLNIGSGWVNPLAFFLFNMEK